MSHDAPSRASALTALIRRPYFWGIIAIALLLAVTTVKDPGYLAISYNESTGNLVGNLIDILRAAAPIAMISVGMCLVIATAGRSEEHTSELQSRFDIVCRLLLEKKKD